MPRRTHPRKNYGRIRPRQTDLGSTWFNSLDGSLFCPCGKMSARTEQEAWDIALSIYRSRGGIMPQRVYSDCPLANGAWHWTSKP